MSATDDWHAQFERKQKLLEPLVQRAMERVRAAVRARQPKIVDALFYGAIGINPKHLAVWYIFKTTVEKREAEASGLVKELDQMTRDALRAGAYAEEAISLIGVAVASSEEINQGGGWDFFR